MYLPTTAIVTSPSGCTARTAFRQRSRLGSLARHRRPKWRRPRGRSPGVIGDRHLVDDVDVARLDHALGRTLQNSAILRRSFAGISVAAAAQQDVGLDADARSSLTECCVGLVLSSPAVGNPR